MDLYYSYFTHTHEYDLAPGRSSTMSPTKLGVIRMIGDSNKQIDMPMEGQHSLRYTIFSVRVGVRT